MDWDDPDDWDENAEWENWRAEIDRLVDVNVDDYGVLDHAEGWTIRQLGELLIARAQDHNGDRYAELAALREALTEGRQTSSLANVMSRLSDAFCCAFGAGHDIAFERALDALNQALESIARHRDRQSSEVGRASEATASDSELPEF